ncbi:MAG: DUF3299 domain-containing protein [Bacteroidota bacterium]
MRIVVLVVLLPLTTVASSAVSEAQTSLGWTTLDEVYVDPRTDRVVYPETIRPLRGETIRVTGFLLPLDAHTSPKRFLLSALSLADCFYCQPTGPGTTIEVRAAQPVRMQTTRPVRIEGRLVLLSYRGRYDGGLVYRLDRAQLIP